MAACHDERQLGGSPLIHGCNVICCEYLEGTTRHQSVGPGSKDQHDASCPRSRAAFDQYCFNVP